MGRIFKLYYFRWTFSFSSVCPDLVDSHVQMKCSSCQPLLHGLCTHSLLGGHSLIVVQKLKFQQVVIQLCSLSHLILAVGDAGDDAEVVVDNPTNS